jgi:multidrug resistance efflux pump
MTANTFSRTQAAQRKDREHGTLAWVIASSLLTIGWIVWLLIAEVTVYATSEGATLEASARTHVLQSPVTARVVASHVLLGAKVRQGDALLELDASQLELARTEHLEQASVLRRQLEALDAAMVAQGRYRESASPLSRARRAEVAARREQAVTTEQLAKRRLETLAALRARGLASEDEFQAAAAEFSRSQAFVLEQSRALERLQEEEVSEMQERGVGYAELARERARVEHEIQGVEAAELRLRLQIEERTLRAPVDGRIGELVDMRPGAVLQVGDAVASIVPEGTVTIVAYFSAQTALGRIDVGQSARMRLDGFAWSQFGFVGARVDRVGNVPVDGRVRVDLEVVDGPDALLLHGLPGVVEVAVERARPFDLLLRAAGRRLQTPTRELEARAR